MNKGKTKLSVKNILFFLLFLYPILPVNYYIGRFSYVNICSLLIILIYTLYNGKVKILRLRGNNFGFWQYLFICGLFTFFTVGPITGIANIVSGAMVSMVVILLMQEKNDFYKVIDLIIISSFFLGILGCIESLSGAYLIQGDLLNESEGMRYGVLRCSVSFGHPINFGMYQAISAILAFYRLNTDIERKKKKLYIIAYLIAVISMFLAVSRLVICFFFSVQIILLLKMDLKKVVKYLLITTFVVIIGTIVFRNIGLEVSKLIDDFIISLCEMLGIGNKISNTETIGFGNRFDLYGWVIDSIGDKWLWGLGIGAEFAYKMTDWFTKTSIEVHYLYIFYQCGLVGVVSLVISYISTWIFFYTKRKNTFDSEKKISFLSLLVILLLIYYICLFGVQETDLFRLHCEIVSLGISYYRIYKKESKVICN